MSSNFLSFFLIIGLVFGALAGAIGFLITYIEYRKHLFKSARLWRESLTVGLFTFGVFFACAMLIGLVLSHTLI